MALFSTGLTKVLDEPIEGPNVTYETKMSMGTCTCQLNKSLKKCRQIWSYAILCSALDYLK